MTARRFALTASALLPAAALGVHELRYRLAFGDETGSALAEHGHGYLGVALPLVALLCAIGCARLLLGVARGLPELPGRVGFARMWLACAAALFAVYAGQELLEGAVSAGHSGGWNAVFAAGGWMSAPLCVLIGLASRWHYAWRAPSRCVARRVALFAVVRNSGCGLARRLRSCRRERASSLAASPAARLPRSPEQPHPGAAGSFADGHL